MLKICFNTPNTCHFYKSNFSYKTFLTAKVIVFSVFDKPKYNGRFGNLPVSIIDSFFIYINIDFFL